MNIIDLSAGIPGVFEKGHFHLGKWESYMDACLPGAKEMCLQDARETIRAGFSWEADFLPVLDAVLRDAEKRGEAVRSFRRITEHLDERITAGFGKTVDADLILYLGLCSGAGWVTSVNGRTTVLFGIEKIMELNWQDQKAMTGLILHELGHVYQAQYGVLHRDAASARDRFLWQLFTEGIAMVFEQEIIGDPECFHQYDTDWKRWCDEHAGSIARSFSADLDSMTPETQRYFGDWVRFEGHGDTGYYLGARFIRFLLKHDRFDDLLSYDMDDVGKGYGMFSESLNGTAAQLPQQNHVIKHFSKEKDV